MLLLAGSEDAEKQQLVQQLAKLDQDYQGGLVQYIANAKQLLADSRQGKLGARDVAQQCSWLTLSACRQERV